MGCSSSRNVQLSDEDVHFLLQNTKYDEKTIREWYQGFSQDCPDGKLSRDRFLEMYQMFFTKGNPEEFCNHVFRTFDEDDNGHVDFKEFLLAVGVTTSTNTEEKLKWAFKMYDINKDGLIQLPEMTKIVKALYEMLGAHINERPLDTPEERTKKIFDKMDTNKDGRLSLPEFVNGCTEDSELSKLLTTNIPSPT